MLNGNSAGILKWIFFTVEDSLQLAGTQRESRFAGLHGVLIFSKDNEQPKD
jgi:hypothetical protein